jgi:hypothetical protein
MLQTGGLLSHCADPAGAPRPDIIGRGTVASVCSDTMVGGCEEGRKWVLSSNAY